MFKLILTLAATAAAATSAMADVPTQPGEFVKNGGFGTTTLTGSFEFGASYKGRETSVADWTSANANAYNILFDSSTANTKTASTRFSGDEYVWSSTPSPHSGGNFVALDGDPTYRGALTQMITGLTVGQVYTLTFDWAAAQLRSRSGATTEQIHVTFGTDAYDTGVLSIPTHGFSGWQSVSTSFTAKNTSQLLSFMSNGTPAGFPPLALLDSVSLTAAVPEPASWAMMIVGFGAVGCAIRRKRATATFA